MTHPAARKRGAVRIDSAAARKRGGVFLRNLCIIAAAGALLRLGVGAELGAVNGGHNSVYTPSKLSDLATYMRLAREIAEFRYSGEFYYQPFYYAVFLPVLRRLSGGAVGMVIFVQSLLGGATAFFAGLAGARLFGRTAGYAAAVLTAISTPLLLYAPFHQNETLQAFNLAVLFYLCLRASDPRGWSVRRWAAAGALCGIAILTRGNVWLLTPGIAAAVIVSGCRAGAAGRRIVAALGCFLAVTVALQLPFIWHNSRIRGRLTGPSTAADAVLALGNSKEAPAGGRNPGLPAGPMEYPAAYQAMMERVSSGVSVPRQMWEWMCEEPGAFFELQFRKLLLFWDGREIPNNVSLYGEGEFSRILQWLVPGRSALLLALAFAGLLTAPGKRRTGVLLMIWFLLAFWAAAALFYILSRFRAPILPAAAVAAGGWIGTLRRRLRLDPPRRAKTLLFFGGALLIGFWLTTGAYEFYRRNCECAVLRAVRPNGTTVQFKDRSETFDYGPFTFGGWAGHPVAAGSRIGKTFAVPSSPGDTVVMQWETTRPGRIVFRLPDGRRAEARFPESGLSAATLPAAEEYTVMFLSGEHRPLLDTQRNYGRSRFDGLPIEGEWLMRKITSKEEK